MKPAKLFLLFVLVAGVSLIWVASGLTPAISQRGAQFGDPLPGLTAEQLELFKDGLEDFKEVEEVEKGLGPGFNARSCGECHSTPAPGGASAMTVVRFGRVENGQYDPLTEKGGSLLQLFAIASECQERVPAEANVVASRVTTPLFGAGLVENIPDEAIIANAEGQSAALRGRVHMVMDAATKQMRVGRFGWKAQQATLLSFSADAYLNEMGITSPLQPDENAPNGDAKILASCDKIPDPEDQQDPKTGLYSIDKFANFMRFLGPPPRGRITAEVTQGEALFNQIGCAACHTPEFQTGEHEVAALSRQRVRAFSDFLLHNVGTGDQIVQGDARGSELRTPPLWGLRGRGPYLHDRSAATPEQAIAKHRQQGNVARRAFNALSSADRQALLAFLNSL